MEAFGYQRTVIGYHGCDQSVVDSIINRNGHLKRSENRYDWLGKGIYFWEFGPSRANEWAIQRVKDGSNTIKVPAVLGAIINLGRCFDLLDVANTHLLSEMYPPFERFMEILHDSSNKDTPDRCKAVRVQWLEKVRNQTGRLGTSDTTKYYGGDRFIHNWITV
jgi:hypothetical protein